MGLVSLLFSFNGRINRAQYWLGTLSVNFVNWMVMFAIAGGAAVPAVDKNPAAALAAASAQLAVVGPLSLAVAWMAIALQVKRFHDRGQSGWWSLLPLAPVVLMIGNFFAAFAEQWPPERLFASMGVPFLALIVISIGFFINLGCMTGTDGPNKYDHTPGNGGASSGSNAAAAASSLFGAQTAIDRAVAENARMAATAPMAPAPIRAAPAAPGGFGHKPAR